MACAHRRLGDELGIEGLVLTHKEQIEYRADVGNDMVEHELVDLFVATPDQRPAITMNPDEVQDIRWLTLADLEREIAAKPTDFTPWLRIYLSEHKDLVFGRF